jgi:hypothetical protein
MQFEGTFQRTLYINSERYPGGIFQPFGRLHLVLFSGAEDYGHTGKEVIAMNRQKIEGEFSHRDEEVDFSAGICASQEVYQAMEMGLVRELGLVQEFRVEFSRLGLRTLQDRAEAPIPLEVGEQHRLVGVEQEDFFSRFRGCRGEMIIGKQQ